MGYIYAEALERNVLYLNAIAILSILKMMKQITAHQSSSIVELIYKFNVQKLNTHKKFQLKNWPIRNPHTNLKVGGIRLINTN